MHKSFLPARAGAVVVAAFVSFAAHAQTPADESDAPLTILITASRFAETADEAMAPVTVVTRADIEAQQAATVEEALRTVPGISFGVSGGRGQLSSLFLRGANSNHVLVLVDGVKVSPATNGLTQFEHLPIDHIERIEVVRGPRSSLYGSEAIGGVVQIFTRRGRGQGGKTRPRFAVTVGSRDTGQLAAGLSRGGDNWYDLGASWHGTDGYDTCRAAFCIAERDADDYENAAFSARGGAAVSDRLAVKGGVLYADSDTDFDGFYNASRHIAQSAHIKLKARAGEAWQWSLLAAESRDYLKSFSSGAFGNRFRAARRQFNWQNDFRLGGGDGDGARLTAGVDHTDERAAQRPAEYAVNARDNTGVFALLRAAAGAHDWEFALRGDDNSQFGGHQTGSVAWGRSLGGARLTVAYASAFNAPTFGQLYAAAPFDRGNPRLDPERARSWDFGLKRRRGDSSVALNLFRTEIDDLIAYRSDPVQINYFNISRAKITGGEISATHRRGAWDFRAGLGAVKPVNAGRGPNHGKLLPRRPRHTATIDIARRIGRVALGMELLARSQAPDNAANTVTNAGYALVNLRMESRVAPRWSLGAKFNNLLDKDYESVAGYPQEGFNLSVTLRYVPGD